MGTFTFRFYVAGKFVTLREVPESRFSECIEKACVWQNAAADRAANVYAVGLLKSCNVLEAEERLATVLETRERKEAEKVVGAQLAEAGF